MLIADSQVHIWTSGTPVHIHRQVSHYTKDELPHWPARSGPCEGRRRDCAQAREPEAHDRSHGLSARHEGRRSIRAHDDLVALAKYPNVAVKASGAPSYSSDPYPYRNIHGYLQQIFDALGPQRMFWGTDITRMPISWRQCITMFTEELSWLKGRDLELVMGRALCKFVGWK